MTSSSWTRAIGVSAVVVLAACGGGDAGDAPNPTEASTSGSGSDSTQSPDSTLSPEDAFLEDVGYEGGTIAAILGRNEPLSTLLDLLTETELLTLFEGDDPYTVFAPAKKAFDDLPPGVFDKLQLPENRQILIDILKYHVVEGDYRLANLTSGELTALQGGKISIEITPSMNFMETLKVNGQYVIVPNMKADNGTIHIINWIMLPPGVDLEAL